MRRSFDASLDGQATLFPTASEHQQPLEYELPFGPRDLIGFRRRWSSPGSLVTQDDLARMLGLHERQIRRYENGENAITQVLVMALCWLDLKLSELRLSARS